MAKELAMLENTEKGKKVRTYFINVEKMFNSPEYIVKRALQIQNDKIKELQSQNTVLLTGNITMTPKAEAYDCFMSGENTLSMGDTAKMLNTGRTKLFSLLKKEEILMENRIPYQQYMKYFEVIDVPYIKEGNIINVPTTRVKPEGVEFIRKRLNTNKPSPIRKLF